MKFLCWQQIPPTPSVVSCRVRCELNIPNSCDRQRRRECNVNLLCVCKFYANNELMPHDDTCYTANRP